MTVGGRLAGPGVDAALGNHEGRIRALERQPFPDPVTPGTSGSATWLVGGYQGLILLTPNVLNFYRFTDVGGASFLKDWYGGVAPADLVVTTGPAPDVPVTLNHSHSVTPLANDDWCALYTAINPSSLTLDSHSDLLGPSSVNQTAKWGSGSITTASWECWVSPDPSAPIIGKLGPILYGFSPSALTQHGSYLAWDYTNSRIVFNGAVGARLNTATLAKGSVTGDVWYHVVVTISAGFCKLYLNGVLVASDTTHSEDLQQATAWKIGAGSFFNSAGGGNFFEASFQGAIAEVAMYNRVLSPSEVLLHYNGTGPSTDTGRWIVVPYSAGAVVGPGSVDTAEIVDHAVTEVKIAANAVGTTEIAASAVTTTQILDGTILAADLAATLKPSGSAIDTTESLRALGTAAGNAMKGTDGRAAKATPAYSASITPDSSAAVWQTITVTNGTAFAINAPSNPPSSTQTQHLTIEVLNSSGGTMGAITWNAAFVFDLAQAWVNPASTMRRQATFCWNGTAWVLVSISNADY